jgi:gluconate 2-dehydrogenase gamma chain
MRIYLYLNPSVAENSKQLPAFGYILMGMLPTRRDLVDLAVRAAALPGAAEFFAAWLRAEQEHQHDSGSAAPPEPPLLRDYKPQFFAPEDFEALQGFTEILIPTDDTPGAREARCAHYIDFLMQASGPVPQTQKAWRDAMAALKDAGFHASGAQGRAALVEAMSKPERDRTVTHPAYAAYRLIKQLNTFAFYTSRAGMIDALEYKGNSYNASFPACTHPEHRVV